MDDFVLNPDELLPQLTLEEKASLCSGSDFWHTRAIPRLGIPAVMMCDGPHGLRKQETEGDNLGINDSIKAVCFPSAGGLAASFDRDLLSRLGGVLGEECRRENIAMLLGPGLNMKRSPLCGRNFEYFSEDPYLAGQLAASYVSGLQAKGVAACPKHFAANNQETRRMSGSSQVDERTLHEIYLSAFEDMVKNSKPRSIMCSYNQINGTFSSENRELLTDILRDRWGFTGFVVTDWGAGKDRCKGLYAGVDLEMPGGESQAQIEQIVNAVRSGALAESELDAAVRNVLQFVADAQKNTPTDGKIDFARDHAFSVDAAAECAVLLKNERNLLPLRKEQKVAFIGEFADFPRYQGAGSSHVNTDHVVGACAAAAGYPVIFAQGYDSNTSAVDETLIAEAVATAKAADIAVIFAGLPASYEAEGFDRKTMAMPENQNRLIEAVLAANANSVVVLHNGAPVEMPWADRVPGILEMYLGGEGVGEAAVKLLYGDANPSGKLAETFPLKLSHNPSYLFFPGEGTNTEYREGIFIGYRYYDKKDLPVLFPFGHGLSYTTFTYSDLHLSCHEMVDSDTLTVTCRVKNTGSCAGKEVVQLYVADPESSVVRPVRELKGFQKVSLQPGEEKTVAFTLEKKAFAYYETKIHDWFVESGDFLVEVGASSRDIRLRERVFVRGTKELPLSFTPMSTFADLLTTEKGRALFAKLAQMTAEKAGGTDQAATVSDSGEDTSAAMLMEMSIGIMATFVGMTAEQIDGLIADLNCP